MGVMTNSYEKIKKAPITVVTGTGNARGGGAAFGGSRFSDLK